MKPHPVEEFLKDYVGMMTLAALAGLAIILTPVALAAIPAYVFYRLYSESPRRAERLAREATVTLYNHALAGQVVLSEDDIDEALARSWPPMCPRRCKYNFWRSAGRSLPTRGCRPRSHRHRRCATPSKAPATAINSPASVRRAVTG